MVGKINNSNQVNPIDPNKLKNAMTYSGRELSFETMLKDQLNKTNGLQFSKHAKERVEQRGIEVTTTLMDSLNQAVEKARSKGAKDVVVIGRSGAFIVNIPNNVVVTTMSENEMKDNIFTNIDSAVIL